MRGGTVGLLDWSDNKDRGTMIRVFRRDRPCWDPRDRDLRDYDPRDRAFSA